MITLGTTRIATTRYERQLFQAIKPIDVSTRAQAIADVATGRASGRADHPVEPAATCSAGADQSAYVQVIYNGDAINQSLVEDALESKLAQANAELAEQLEKVADGYIDLLLSGGKLSFLGLNFNVLGLRDSATILDGVLNGLPRWLAGCAPSSRPSRASRRLRSTISPARKASDRRGRRADRACTARSSAVAARRSTTSPWRSR